MDRVVDIRLQAQIAQYEQSMERAKRATDRVGEAGQKSGGLISRGFSAAVDVASKVTATTVTATTVLAGAIVKVGGSYNTLEQKARAAFTTILGSGGRAEMMMQNISQFAMTSPFPRQVFIEGAQQLAAFNMKAQDIIPTMSAVQDAVAASGGSSQKLREIIYVLAQISASGRITGQDLMQLGQRGINAADIIGEQMGLAGTAVKENITNGALDADTALNYLVTGMTEKFGGAAENVKNTWVGATDRISAAFRDTASIIMEPFISVGGGGYALDWANAIADGMRAIQRQVDPLVDAIVGRFGPGLDDITEKLQGIAPAIDKFSTQRVVDEIDDLVGYIPLIGGVGTALTLMATNSVPLLSTLGLTGINPVVGGIAALVALHPELRAVLGDFLNDLSPLIPVARDTAGALLDAGTAILEALVPGLSDLLTALSPAVVALGTGLGGSAAAAAQALVPAADVLGIVLTAVSKIPEPLLIAVGAFALLRAVNLGPLGSGIRNLNQQMAVQQSLAGMAGKQIGFFGSASAVASTSVSRLGLAIKAAFLTNPIGWVIAGISTAIGVWSSVQGKANAKASEARQRVDELSSSLDQNTGAYTENTRAVVAKRLQEEGLIAIGKELGLSSSQLVDAVLDEGNAYSEVQSTYESTQKKLEELHASQIRKGYSSAADARATGKQIDKYVGFSEALGIVRSDSEDAVDQQLELSEAINGGADATEGLTNQMEEGAGKLANFTLSLIDVGVAQQELAAINKEAQEAFDEWVNSVSDAGAAFVDHKGAMDAVQTSTKEWAEQQAQEHRDWAEETGNAVNEAKDEWTDYYDGMSVNLEKYLEELRTMAEAQANWQENIQSLVGKVPDEYLDMLIGMGVEAAPLIQALVDDQTGATDEIVEIWGETGKGSQEAFAQNLSAQRTLVGLVAQEQGKELGSKMIMGLSEKLKTGELTARDVIEEYDLRAELELLANTDPAYRAVLEEIQRIEDMEATAKITADSSLAIGVAQDWFDQTENMVPTPVIDADSWKADREAQWWYEDTADMVPTPVIDADAWKAEREADWFYRETSDMVPVMDIDANDYEAQRELDNWFYRNDGRSLSVAVKAAVSSANVGYDIGVGNANGGFYQRNNGGFDQAGGYVKRESMMGGPQFGRTNVLWGEPETGWEAYISGKPGMRERNVQIWEEAGRRLGMNVLDTLGVQKFARGNLLDTNINLKGSPVTGRSVDSLVGDWADHNLTASLKQQTGDWRALWAMVQPWGVGLTSAYRPGAVTATGYKSKHSLSKAIDVTPNYALWKFLEAQKSSFAELYGPWGLWLRGMNRYAFPGAGITARNHRDHIHIASYSDGGFASKMADDGRLTLDPGLNTVYNGLGRLEHMVDVSRFGAGSSAASSPGDLQVRLSQRAEDVLVSAALAAREQPISVKVGAREVAYATREGEEDFGQAGRWSGAPRLGRK